jgi:hypothetical protein
MGDGGEACGYLRDTLCARGSAPRRGAAMRVSRLAAHRLSRAMSPLQAGISPVIHRSSAPRGYDCFKDSASTLLWSLVTTAPTVRSSTA